MNGWAAGKWSLAQRNGKNIGDTNIDEEVVGFVRADKNMMPIPQFARRDTAYPVNGYANTPPSTVSALSQKRDISQPGVEPNVYDFVHDKVEALNWERRPVAYNNNGYDAPTPHWGALSQSEESPIRKLDQMFGLPLTEWLIQPLTSDPIKFQKTPTNHTLEFKSHTQKVLQKNQKRTQMVLISSKPNSSATQKESTFLTQSPTKPTPMETPLMEVSKSEEPLSTTRKPVSGKVKTQ